MKVTKFGQNQGLVSNASSAGTASGIGGVQVIGGAQPGQAIISSGSNSANSSNSATWQPVVSTISANGSNILLGPHVNLSSGSNVVLSVSSNTLFIHSTGGGSTGNFVTVIDGGGESVYAHGGLGTTETIDLSLGNYHTGTLNANCTFTFTVTAGVAHRWFTLELLEDGTGGWTPTFPGSVVRIDGSPAHDTTAGTTTIYVFWTINGGTTWKGGVLGGGPSLGSTSTDVTNTSAAGAGTTASPVTHTHTGVVLVTSNSSNSLLRPIANFASGSGIRHSIASNTLTISTELTSPVMEAAPHWELVMQDGVTAPPEPVENEARDDWLYGLVP